MNGWTDDALALVLRLRGWTPEAIQQLGLTWDDLNGRPVGIPVVDATGDRVGVLRYDPTGETEPKMLAETGSTRDLFPPPETLPNDVNELVLGEGEPDVLALLSAGFTAVGVPGTGGWKREYAGRFSGRRWTVYVTFDCADVSRRSAATAAHDLAAAGVDARVVELDPSRDDDHDVTDFLLEHGAEALRALLEQAEPYRLPAEGAPPGAGDLPAVPLADLLDEHARFYRRFLAALTDAHFDILALWDAHTFVVAAADSTPYPHVTSAEIESGKTRLLEVADLLTCRSAPLLDPTAASLYRGLESGEIVTLLIDEVDNFLPGGKADSDAKKSTLAILNSGYRRGMRVPRVTDGRTLEWFSPFGPKMLCGNGELPRALASRSLRIRMRRRRRDEPIERFRRKRAAREARPLTDGVAAWAASPGVLEALEAADPELPDELGDREQDVCEPLVAIADLAGGDWPRRARAAFVHLFAGAREAAATESQGVRLLADVRDVLEGFGERVSTADLLAKLNGLEERPWGGWNDGAGLRPRNLAGLLRPFEVHSTTVRLDDDKVAKGYKREDFDDAFARYLAPYLAPLSVTSVTTAQPSKKPADSIRYTDPHVTDSKRPQTRMDTRV